MMLLQAILFVVGLVLLYFGAEWLIKGAASVALQYGIRPLVVGITVVALGTSMPEFVVNFFAAITGEESLALGNIVGSNICNIALILGTTALIFPLAVSPATLKKEYPIMMAVLFLFYALALDGVIGRVDGLLLIAGLAGFLLYLVIDSKRHKAPPIPVETSPVRPEDVESPIWKKVAMVVFGIVVLAGGARLMVYAAVNVAQYLGIDPVVIGLTVVAIGTSLPELAASVVSALKQEADISVGNVLGSNMLNVLFVVGFVSLYQPLHVDATSLNIHFPVMLAVGLILFPMAWMKFTISRIDGGILVAGYSAYMLYLALPYL